MTRWTDHNDTERMVMLQQAADAEGLPEYAVEKDWWADYDELLMHFVYGNKLSFDELLERVSELNRRFNGGDYK